MFEDLDFGGLELGEVNWVSFGIFLIIGVVSMWFALRALNPFMRIVGTLVMIPIAFFISKKFGG